AWILVDNFSDFRPIISKSGTNNNTAAFDFQIQDDFPGNNGNLQFFMGTGSGIVEVSGTLNFTGVQDIATATWTHVAAVVEGNDMRLYINGIPRGTATYSGTRQLNDNPIQIGRYTNGTEQFWDGGIDEVRIWNDARTASEIADNYTSELRGDEAGLVGYYQFDNGVSGTDNLTAGYTKLFDRSVNNLDGTLTNFALSGATSNWVTSGAMSTGVTPDVPADVYATRLSDTQIQLNWTDGANESGYRIFRADNYNFDSNVTQVVDLPANTTTYTHTVAPGEGYFYRITAYDGALTADSNVEFATTEAFPGQALSFDGVNDYTNATEAIGALPDLTVAAWIYPRSFGGSNSWVYWRGNTSSNQTGGELYVTPAGLVGYGESDVSYQGITSSSSIPLNQWTHVAVSKTGGSAQLYINGVADGSAGTIDGTPPNGEISLGARVRLSGTDGYFDGIIDEVRIWNLAKTDFSDRFNGLQGNEAGLVVYYPLDEGSGAATTVDRSINTVDGTIFGATSQPADYQLRAYASNVTLSSFTATYEAPAGLASATIDVDDDPAFGSPSASGLAAEIDGDTEITGQTFAPNTPYYYRVNYTMTGGSTPTAVSESFMVTPGNALSFDGGDDHIRVENTGNIQTLGGSGSSFTVEAWFKGAGSIVTKGQGGASGNAANTGFRMTSSDIGLGQNGGASDFDFTIPSLNNNAWNHLALVRDAAANQVRLYLNGTEIMNQSYAGTHDLTSVQATSFLTIGATIKPISSFGVADHFDGEIDEVRIWDDVRLPAEIQSNLFTDLSGTEANLVAYYRFDEGSASGSNTGFSSLPDLSGNGNVGTLNGPFALNGTSSNWIASGAMAPTPYQATAVSTSGF
ncbi:MAG: hypothetical protein HRT61_22075, partial [Ekhidna sp.]|nr:hypothetical protein [Ekhidna sp.]